MQEKIIKLDTPIKRGETEITAITLRKPSAGELRGINLADLLQLNVSTVQKVIPRISNPALTEHEVGQMDPADFTDMAAELTGFLLKKDQQA